MSEPSAVTLEQLAAAVAALTHVNHRGLAIIYTAWLDELLLETLKDAVIEHDGPQKLVTDSSFAQRIELAFGLGLLSAEEYRELTLIRKIRNDFAHKGLELSFGTPPIKERCAELRDHPRIGPSQKTDSADLLGSNGAKFFRSVMFLSAVLIARRRDSAFRRPAIPPSMTPDDILPAERSEEPGGSMR